MTRLTERYRAFLPIGPGTPDISLGEGGTPLVHARRLGASMGLSRLYLKVEGQNPTGSFKDRGMVVAVARAVEDGATAVVCASTGNTSASAAAYGAAAGIEVVVILPAGRIATGKLLQARMAGARIVAIDGGFDVGLRVVRDLAADPSRRIALVNSVNPDRIEGQKTAAFEVCDSLGAAPDILAIPVGNAGNITAYWKGFREYMTVGVTAATPAMWGFQAAGAAPIVEGHPILEPETVATAIRIGHPASWDGAVDARDASGGRIEAVSDGAILDAFRDVARLEGIFCEPASAASVAGVRAFRRDIDPDAGVVCVLTGAGLKDPETAGGATATPILPAPPTLDGVRQALGW
jgi:threonine synthase